MVPGGAWAATGQPCSRAGGKHIPPLAAGQAEVRLEERDPQSVSSWLLPPWSSWAGRGLPGHLWNARPAEEDLLHQGQAARGVAYQDWQITARMPASRDTKSLGGPEGPLCP